MSELEKLAKRLHQSVQGCTIHMHGPVQAWLEILDAESNQQVSRKEILKNITSISEKRINQLLSEGAKEDDVRVSKEKIAISFMKKLLE